MQISYLICLEAAYDIHAIDVMPSLPGSEMHTTSSRLGSLDLDEMEESAKTRFLLEAHANHLLHSSAGPFGHVMSYSESMKKLLRVFREIDVAAVE